MPSINALQSHPFCYVMSFFASNHTRIHGTSCHKQTFCDLRLQLIKYYDPAPSWIIFPTSQAFFLNLIEGNYDTDPPLALHQKKNPLQMHALPVIICYIILSIFQVRETLTRVTRCLVNQLPNKIASVCTYISIHVYPPCRVSSIILSMKAYML